MHALLNAEATPFEDGELLIIATNRRPKTALMDYRLRWGIETLFAALKSRGFNLESTHFCYAERLSKLMALLALAFCWAMIIDNISLAAATQQKLSRSKRLSGSW